MKRSFSASAVLIASICLVSIPAAPAHASLAATAALTSTRQAHPGEHTFNMIVRNNEPAGLFGSGRSINGIRVFFPVEGVALSNRALNAAGSFTNVYATNLGSAQYITWRGGTLSPGTALSLSFPGVVLQPADSDGAAEFRVTVTADDFRFAQDPAPPHASQALTVDVRVLEIVAGTFAPVSPTTPDSAKGVTDGSGTAYQAITYGYTVRNHARDQLFVEARLESADEVDVPGKPVTVAVDGSGGTREIRIPVWLGGAAADRQTSFAATVLSWAGSGATASASSVFSVQAPVVFTVSNLLPTRVRSGVARALTIQAMKTWTPGAELLEGSLVFGQNTLALSDSPVRFNSGNVTRSLPYGPSPIVGVEGAYSVVVTGNGLDDNLAEFSFVLMAGTVTIDDTPPGLTTPMVDMPRDADGDLQTAVKSGDRVGVSGVIEGTDLAPGTLRVVFQPNAGPPIHPACSTAATPTGTSYSCSASPTWDPIASSFVANVQVLDLAGNVGSAQSGPYPIDVDIPSLEQPAVVMGTRTIVVRFSDFNGIRGGCEATSYLIDGRPLVSKVLSSDGSPCVPSNAPPDDGVRVLVLGQSLDHDATPSILYVPPPRIVGMIPAKDGAGRDVPMRSITSVTQATPPAPPILEVRRRDGSPVAAYEPAFLDTPEKRYYTNVGGVDGVEVTVGGVRQGYKIRVLDSAGNVLTEKTRTQPIPPSAFETTETINVPLGGTDGSYQRSIVIVSTSGNQSPGSSLTVALDTVAPTIVDSHESSGRAVVTFSEKIAAGSNFADDWLVREHGGSGSYQFVGASYVESVNETSRILGLDNLRGGSFFAGAFYYLQNSASVRYEDRAGNPLTDTI